MFRLLLSLLFAAFLVQAAPVLAEPADIDAAARGVVRVVVVERDGEEISAVSHGTGFAVGPETVVTNAHVVEEALADSQLSLGIVPSDGGSAVFARLVAVSRRNDLALLSTTAPMRLSPLTISGNPATDSGPVTSVGYPQNVDRAQGLGMEDIFRAQPPVKSNGFLSGRRPSRDFDTLLHTAPIARGSSGGPLLDECGRVVGVNSFGAESSNADAEFFFAVSTRELLPFLRANDVTPRINAMPCRSIAELEAEERARQQRMRREAQSAAAAGERERARRQEEARREITFAVHEERDNRMAIAFLLLVVGLGAGLAGWLARLGLLYGPYEEHHDDDEIHDDKGAYDEADVDADADAREEGSPARGAWIGGGIAVLALAGAGFAWFSRPGFDQIEMRLEDRLRAEMQIEDSGPVATEADGPLTCTLVPRRSRVIGEAADTIPLEWSAGGCVNARTQYGLSGGTWTRVLVPASEAAVSVNSFDPASGEYVVERYLLDSDSMGDARAARSGYEAPACEAGEQAAGELGARQSAIIALLPDQPNERLVYECGRGVDGATQR